MARRTNHPLKTLLLLGVLGTAGYFAYEYLYVRKVLAGGNGPDAITSDRRDEIRERILKTYQKDECLIALGAMSYRSKEGHWRIDIEVADGCDEEASRMCRGISELVEEDFHLTASVWAADTAGRHMGHYVP